MKKFTIAALTAVFTTLATGQELSTRPDVGVPDGADLIPISDESEAGATKYKKLLWSTIVGEFAGATAVAVADIESPGAELAALDVSGFVSGETFVYSFQTGLPQMNALYVWVSSRPSAESPPWTVDDGGTGQFISAYVRAGGSDRILIQRLRLGQSDMDFVAAGTTHWAVQWSSLFWELRNDQGLDRYLKCWSNSAALARLELGWPLQLKAVDTAARDAFTLRAGLAIYNTDTAQVEWCDGAAWHSAGGIADLVDDTTPQLGGMLDANGFAIGDGTLELLDFAETPSAVNHLRVTNAATGTGPTLAAVGDDADIPLLLTPKGTGAVSQRNGANAQASRIYNTFTDASNGEWLEADWQTTANTLRLGTNANGTGTVRDMALQTNGGNVGFGITTPSATLHAVNTSGSGVLRVDGRSNIIRGELGNANRYLLNIDDLSSGGAAASDRYLLRMSRDGSNLFTFANNGNAYLSGNVGIGTTTPNQLLTVQGTMSLKEQAAASADTASYGQVWVKDDAPNTLWFTSDTGVDTQLGVSVSGLGTELASTTNDITTSNAGDVLRLAGAGESLDFDFSTGVPNQIDVSSATGVTDIDFQAIGLSAGALDLTGNIDLGGGGQILNGLIADFAVVQIGQEINIGHPTDTTLERAEAGVLAVEGAVILTDGAGAIARTEVSADPADPAEGASVTWVSDGTGFGDPGDFVYKGTEGGVTKTVTLVDFSAATDEEP